MIFETAEKAEEILNKIRIAKNHLEDMKKNVEPNQYGNYSLEITGRETVHLSDEEKDEVGKLLVSYFEEKIKTLDRMLEEL
jgi:hypothetical protein